jgi:hypothetical protein
MTMMKPNPYSAPSTSASELASRETASTRRLWIAYGIAPAVGPLLAAMAVFVSGFIYLATHPENTGTPIGVIALPIVLLLVGVPASYAAAGVIGMPIAFWLRRRSKLNGYTVHGATLLLVAVLALVLASLGPVLAWYEAESFSLLEFLGAALASFLVLAPFVLLSATTFWLIGVRQWNRVPVTDVSCSNE